MRLDTTESLRSSDIDELSQAVGRSLCPVRLRPSAPLWARVTSRRLLNVSLTRLYFDTDVRIELDRQRQFFAVQIPIAGSAVVRSGTRRVRTAPGRGSVTAPAQPWSVLWSAGCEQWVVRIDAAALKLHLCDLLGRPLPRPLAFDPVLDLTSGRGRTVYDNLAFMATQLNRTDSMFTDSVMAVANLEQGLMTGLLLAAGSNYRDLLDAPGAATSSRVVSEIVTLIESHPEAPHTIAELARAHGVSVRSLERAFRRDLGASPSAYLRQVRLRRAREVLLASATDAVTVGQVARRLGFVHPGRFALLYRRTFGETPSATLRG
ncbi:AraC family transcriptional regulator [Actinophytocola sp.]|uniref:AraC family transcriptional regulator n=1 Tax=Actinophytocola sp. TaxID=1872138 RepID=UPI002EDA9CA2